MGEAIHCKNGNLNKNMHLWGAAFGGLTILAACEGPPPPSRETSNPLANTWGSTDNDEAKTPSVGPNPWLAEPVPSETAPQTSPISPGAGGVGAESSVKMPEIVSVVPTPVASIPMELQLVEYLEGTGSDKRLTLLNSGNGALEECRIHFYSNGSLSARRSLSLDRIEPGASLVLCTEKAWDPSCQQKIGGSPFNGNDALVVRCGDSILDSLGRVGEDPGLAWSSSTGLSTRDSQLIRCFGPDRVVNDEYLVEGQWRRTSQWLATKKKPLTGCESVDGQVSQAGGAQGNE